MHDQPRHRRTATSTGFGFETIMARPDYTSFRRWYDSNSFFSPRRTDATDDGDARLARGRHLRW